MQRFLALGMRLPRPERMKRASIVFGVLTLLLLCFIWGQSMLPREASAGESLSILSWLKPLLDPTNRIAEGTFHHYLRKAAHFTEYAALGFSMSGFLYPLTRRRGRRWALFAVAACVMTAAIDETIQLFSPDRGPQLRDVLLDSGGAVFGFAVFCLILLLIHRKTAE